jgi:hypothetical protein
MSWCNHRTDNSTRVLCNHSDLIVGLAILSVCYSNAFDECFQSNIRPWKFFKGRSPFAGRVNQVWQWLRDYWTADSCWDGHASTSDELMLLHYADDAKRRKGSVCVCCAGSLLSLFASHVHGDGRIWWAGLFLLHRSLFKNLSIGGRALATGRDKHTPTRKGCRYFLQFVGALVFIFGWHGVEDAPPKNKHQILTDSLTLIAAAGSNIPPKYFHRIYYDEE